MANICDNNFFLLTTNEVIVDRISKFAEENEGEVTFYDVGTLENDTKLITVEGYFNSRWNFPISLFEDMIPDGLSETYFRCLSQEYGNSYVAMNIYREGNWEDEQTFDL